MLLYVRIDWYEHDMHGSRSRRTSWSFLDRGSGQGNLSAGRRSRCLGVSHHGEEVGRFEPQQAAANRAFGHGARLSKTGTRVRGKKPGGKPGHEGHHRAPPARIDRKREHRLPCCPDCQGRLKRCASLRTRFIEDIPEGITPIVTEHTIRRDWCPRCKKLVEPKVPDALPGATLGNRTAVMTAWMHYGLGNSISQIVDVFNYHLQMKLTRGGLVNLWQRLQDALFPWYEQIQAEALKSAVLHADETSWRVSGKTHWLWAFANHDLTYYMIDRSRGEPALLRFFIEEFEGTLVSDFWGAYNAVVCAARQGCLVHLLRDSAYRGALQERRTSLAGVFQKAAAIAGRCDPLGTTKARLAGGKLRLPSATDWRTPGRTDCHHLAGRPGKAVGQKAAATSRPPVHIPRQTGSSL